ncbi:MAG: antibiotic biosynthesis monooxygenase family protein [Propionibacteriaceae bacterium]|nr:antibiotic biosynthesis monooxygenase family protein [Propionibacteriaceae bacterium]
MLAISRFSQPGPTFRAEAEAAVEWWVQRPGCLGIDLVQNLDDPELWAIVSRWESVGAYRRSFNGYDAKMILTPLLSRAIDEPSAFLPPEELGVNIPRER